MRRANGVSGLGSGRNPPQSRLSPALRGLFILAAVLLLLGATGLSACFHEREVEIIEADGGPVDAAAVVDAAASVVDAAAIDAMATPGRVRALARGG